MGRCKNEDLLHLITAKKLEDWLPVTFNLYRDADNCMSLTTRNPIDADTTVVYRRYDRPNNQFDCKGGICTTTGTLYVSGEGAQATFFKRMDATQYASGVITMYVKPEAALASGDKVKVTISDTVDPMTNADVYEIEPTAVDGGYYAILVDLTQTPTSTEGTGYEASELGVFVRVELVNGATSKAFGVSTIQFFKSLYDLVLQDIVQIRCLSEAGGTFDVGALERTCTQSGYDTTALDGGIDLTITGKLMTSNWWKLNPLAGFSKYPDDEATSTQGYRVHTVKKTIGNDGTVVIADMSEDRCDFIGAQMDDQCVTPSADLMQKVSAPMRVELNYDQYQVIDGTFYFNSALAGKKVLITYPQIVELNGKVVGSTENIGNVKASMSYPWFMSDGTEEIHTFENVLITSFPFSITNEDGEFSFTVNIQPDADGNWFVTQKVFSEYAGE